jgi:spore germination cell wall hydrolase CwlJ-like protein|tara:strand:+ start:403 stop:954 length:552 start_codon:yes stop_codon:yes gene_type:complete
MKLSNFDKNFMPLWITVFLMLVMGFAYDLKAQPGIDYDYVISQDEHCMALNIYHEARSDSLAGKFAVADVVLNRVRDDRYPKTICGVIYQGDHKPSWKDSSQLVPVRNRCQFSWYCDGKNDTPLDADSWNEAVLISSQIIKNGKHRGLTESATHYHADWIEPYWAPTLQQVGTIGSHIFYRAD